MHDGFSSGLSESELDRLDVGQIPLEKGGAGINGGTVTLAEIIKDSHRVTCLQELFHADAADVAGSAGDQDRLHGRDAIHRGSG